MKFSSSFGTAAALLGLASAQIVPNQVTILTPQPNSMVGAEGKNFMFDIVVEFTAPGSAQMDSASSASSGAAAPTSGSSSSSSSGSSSGSTGVGFGYRRAKRANNAGYGALLNSPSLSGYGAGADPAAPGLVVLLNTSSTMGQNLAGLFQLNAITESDSNNDITQAFYGWQVTNASFGSNVPCQATVFFLKGEAPATYTQDPMSDTNVVGNVVNVDFFIFGGSVSQDEGTPTMKTPLAIQIFNPQSTTPVGVGGADWVVDLAIVNNDPAANSFAKFNATYRDNFTDSDFLPGVPSQSIPGLVVTCNTTAIAGGPQANLANLFQINAITKILPNSTAIEIWLSWLVGSPFAGMGQDSELTIYVMNGTAPGNITTMPTNLLSNVAKVNFHLSGGASSTNTANDVMSAASSLSIAGGAIFLGALAFF